MTKFFERIVIVNVENPMSISEMKEAKKQAHKELDKDSTITVLICDYNGKTVEQVTRHRMH